MAAPVPTSHMTMTTQRYRTTPRPSARKIRSATLTLLTTGGQNDARGAHGLTPDGDGPQSDRAGPTNPVSIADPWRCDEDPPDRALGHRARGDAGRDGRRLVCAPGGGRLRGRRVRLPRCLDDGLRPAGRADGGGPD